MCAGWRVLTRPFHSPPTAKSSAHESQRYHSGRRPRHAALSADARNLEAAIAGLRQAADLLFAHHADDGGPARAPDHHHAGGDRPVQAPARRRTAMGHRAFLCHPGSSRRYRGSLPDRAGFSGRRILRADSGRQHLLRRQSAGAVAQFGAAEPRRDGVRVLGRRSRALRRHRVRLRRIARCGSSKSRKRRNPTTP